VWSSPPAGVRGLRRAADRLGAADLDESRLLPTAAAVTAACLYATLPRTFIAGSAGYLAVARWVVPALAVALIVPLALSAPSGRIVYSARRRTGAIALIAVLTAANTAAIVLLVHLIVNGHHVRGPELIRAALHIWITNVLVFALWFWQLDSGGPMARRDPHRTRLDFLFPQTAMPELAPGWQPKFLDYLYLSFTNSSAFSPTDTMPLTQLAKMLMLLQSASSLLLLAMVAARAVNIL
jgi:hypothetical protein